jgi:hypothetical protein
MANFAARKWPEYRILHHLSQGLQRTPCRRAPCKRGVRRAMRTWHYVQRPRTFGHIRYIQQGLKLRKYFRGQVGPHQINFGSPHKLLGAHQVRIARLTPRLQGALRQGVR